MSCDFPTPEAYLNVNMKRKFRERLQSNWCSCINCLRPHGVQPSRLLYLWNFPGKNTGVGCHFLLQGNLPDLGMEHTSPASPVLADGFLLLSPT